MISFTAKIYMIGVNPYVLLPASALKELFKQAGKNKGPIPICMTINGHAFIQNLVKFNGKWRLYLNTPMRQAAGIDVGDTGQFTIAYDASERITEMHPKLEAALKKNKKAKEIFDQLRPSLQKEIKRYINNLKTEESVERNVTKAINFLLSKERFVGRDNP
jgi:mevalonate pyrophosphate decarboxylase